MYTHQYSLLSATTPNNIIVLWTHWDISLFIISEHSGYNSSWNPHYRHTQLYFIDLLGISLIQSSWQSRLTIILFPFWQPHFLISLHWVKTFNIEIPRRECTYIQFITQGIAFFSINVFFFRLVLIIFFSCFSVQLGSIVLDPSVQRIGGSNC